MKRDGTFRYWWTSVEYAHDQRTGAYARIGDTTGGWCWQVQHSTGTTRGTSTSQKGARAACRRVVRKLPAKEKT